MKPILKKAYSFLVPQKNFEIKTLMSKNRVLCRISEHFDASVSEDIDETGEKSFVIHPCKRAVNRMAPPRIYGIVSEENGMTVIKLRTMIVPSYKVSAILVPPLLIVASLCALIGRDLLDAALCLLFLAVWEGILHASFQFTVNRTVKQLEELLIL